MPSPWLSSRRSLWIVAAALCLYCVGFLIYVPSVLIVADETAYVGQALAFADGRSVVPSKDPLTGELTHEVPAMGYPLGAPLLQTPFVWVGGWRAAPLASVVSLVVLVGLLAHWLNREGKSPLFALIPLGYFPTLVLGRSGMSDVPSGMVATVGLYLFFRSSPQSIARGILAGLVAGASTLVRETNALVFAPLFLGAAVRRERRVLGLVLGGVAGVLLRPLTVHFLLGKVPHLLRSHSDWTIEHFLRNAPLALFSLLVFIPAGLAAAIAYRGPRRPEVIVTLLGFFLFFTSYEYGAFESGGLKRLILAPRYFIPVSPLFAIALADVLPRWRAWLRRRMARLDAPAKAMAGVWVAAVCVAAFSVHPAASRRERPQRDMVAAVFKETRQDALIVTNLVGTRKLLARVYGDRLTLDTAAIAPEQLPRLLTLHGALQLVLLDRSDSSYFLHASEDNRRFSEGIRARCDLTPVHDRVYSGTERLRIWNVLRCPQPDPPRI